MTTGRQHIGEVVKRLVALEIPKAFIWICILVCFGANFQSYQEELTFLEFFAGEGEVWRAMRADSIASIGVDINYFQRQPGEQNPMDILSDAGFGLYIHLILSARTFNFGSVFATVCSSWVWINSYTSGRSLLNPEGDESKQYIRLANMMMSRTVLLLALTVCCGGSYMLEQPSSSLMGEYFRMKWFTEKTRVYKIKWSMGSFGAPSAKPSKGWTNNKQFGLVDQGPYHHDPSKEKLKTVKKTISKSGKVSVSGTTDLKKTQTYPRGFADYLKKIYPGLIKGAEGVPQVASGKTPEAMFESLPFSTWPEANLLPCLRYLRGNRHLQVPKSWLQVFPRPFEVLHKMESRVQD